MRVAVTGGTGFIGGRLLPLLLGAGHEVCCLTRDVDTARKRVPAGVKLVPYDAYDADSVLAALRGGDDETPAEPVDAIINLAGANIAGVRWTGSGRKLIRDSRVVTTRALVQAMKHLEPRPHVLLSGSAVGYYGPREADDICEEDEFDAENFAPRDFLAHVCAEWESAARKAELLGTRVVRLRTGVVLDRGGGALAEMEPPFKLGVGGPIGNGKQVLSWIHREDCARMIVWALETDTVGGPLNVTAPRPVTNKEFSTALGRALGRPAFMPVPVIALRLLKGKVAEMLSTGQTAIPEKAMNLGFNFRYPTLDEALGAIYAPPVVAQAG